MSIELILAIAGVVQLLVVCLVGYLLNNKLWNLHLTMNSRLDELLETTKSLAHAEGFKAGKKDHLKDIDEAGRQVKNRF